jgi:hypothetical protein
VNKRNGNGFMAHSFGSEREIRSRADAWAHLGR